MLFVSLSRFFVTVSIVPIGVWLVFQAIVITIKVHLTWVKAIWNDFVSTSTSKTLHNNNIDLCTRFLSL